MRFLSDGLYPNSVELASAAAAAGSREGYSFISRCSNKRTESELVHQGMRVAGWLWLGNP